jgi:DHA1 family tetracycline resistance protein-like MFS transporter
VGKLLPLLGEKRAIIGGFVWGGLVLVGYGLATQGWMMYALIVLGSLGGIAGPTLPGKVSQMVGPSEQGAVQGALTSLNSVTGIIGPVLVNSLFAFVTAKNTPLPVPGLPFLAGGASMIVGGFVAWRFLNRSTAAPAPEAALSAV